MLAQRRAEPVAETFFWALPQRVAGRAGPDRLSWILDAIHEAGFGAVLSVNSPEEQNMAEFRRLSISHACIRLSHNAWPEDSDTRHCLSALAEAYAYIIGNIRRRRRVLVFCAAGEDPAALVCSYLLMHYADISGTEAMARVKAVCPAAFTAHGWHGFIADVLSIAAIDRSTLPPLFKKRQ